MELLILRHGKAEDFSPEGDAARRLVEKGRRRARGMAEMLARMDRLPELALTSPRTRARETADMFCEAAGIRAPLVEPWLDCGMTPERALRELVAYRDFGRLMIVGHEPDFSVLIESLLGAPGGRVECKKGALAGLEIRPPSITGVLRFLIPPAAGEGSS